jgi:hypothetical protein
MSSGEKAKSPATFEERNPFDISRRSHTEVAGEIAKRMAAWKQARGRSYAAPASAPSHAEKRPQVSAPVQPAHTPKQVERPVAQGSAPGPQARKADAALQQRAPVNSANGTGRARVPYFATFSLERAMPPAPSPRKPDAAAQAPVDSAQSSQATAMPTALDQEITPAVEVLRVEAPAGEGVTEIGTLPAGATAEVEAQRLDAEAAAWPPAEMLLADGDADMIEPPAAEASAPPPDLADSHSVAETDQPDPAQEIDDVRADAPAATETEAAAPAVAADEIEDRRAMARNMRARWIAAHDLDSPHLEESSPAKHSAPATPEPEAREEVSAAIEAIASKAPGIESAAPSTDDEASGQKEPTFDASTERSDTTDPKNTAPVARPSDDAPKKKTDLDAPIERSDSVAEPVAADQPEAPAAMPSAALDASPGRKEPTFGAPMARSDSTARNDAAPAAARVPDEGPTTAAIPIELSGRREPTFDEPAASKRKPKEAPLAAAAGLLKGESGIKLRAIETRIEARRIESLRTDPQAPVGQPIIPHLERDEWDVPSPISVDRRAERHGWAIGLGAILLIVGITAPAAIWQHDRQGSPAIQDQIALDPALLPPQQKEAQQGAGGSTPAATPNMASAVPAAPATAPHSEPAAPQPQATSAPQLTDSRADAPPTPVAKPEADQAAQAQQQQPEQATLGAMQDGGQLDKVPVSAPRMTPKPEAKPQAAPVHLASRAPMPLATASGQAAASPMVAKPFVPEPGSDHFLRAPTTAAATVPIDGGSGAHGASVVVKPTLMAQLKPKPAGAKPVKGAPQIYSPKPAPSDQSLDQMFQTLVDTLSEGKPANPATKPLPPSNRK